MSYAVPHPAARSRLACVVLGFLLLFGVTAGAAAKSDKDAAIGPVALKTADGPLPEPAAYFYERFGGL